MEALYFWILWNKAVFVNTFQKYKWHFFGEDVNGIARKFRKKELLLTFNNNLTVFIDYLIDV